MMSVYKNIKARKFSFYFFSFSFFFSDESLLCEMYNEIMDFALQLSLKKRGSQAAKDVFEMIGNFFVRLKEDSFKVRQTSIMYLLLP